MYIVGILGKAGTGKTTVAEFLANKFGAARFSFATPLKEMASRLLDFSREQLYGTQQQKEAIDPRYGMSGREFMQRLGHEARENLYPRVWIDALVNSIIHDADDRFRNNKRPVIYVVDDIRHKNEVFGLRSLSGVDTLIIRLVCPQAPLAQNPDHPSESEMDSIPDSSVDAVIVNDKSKGIDHLRGQIVQTLMADKRMPETARWWGADYASELDR